MKLLYPVRDLEQFSHSRGVTKIVPGAVFLRKKPLGAKRSVKSRIENAVASQQVSELLHAACSMARCKPSSALIAEFGLVYPEARPSSGFFISGVPADRSSSVGWK
jgi:hypothetical protein